MRKSSLVASTVNEKSFIFIHLSTNMIPNLNQATLETLR